MSYRSPYRLIGSVLLESRGHHGETYRETEMRLFGTRRDGPNWEASYRVAEAVVTPDRIALDWIENGVRYHLLAHSKDGGLTYLG